MFLECHSRFKDGKEHRYWNIVENCRCGRGKFVQRQVLYLGELNDSQRESWCGTIEVFDEIRERTMPLALFPADRQLPNFAAGFGVQVRLKEMELYRPRQWGACWLACHLYEQDLFGSRFEVLLYDLTSTYFESDPVFEEADKYRFG